MLTLVVFRILLWFVSELFHKTNNLVKIQVQKVVFNLGDKAFKTYSMRVHNIEGYT